jgi:hypothetical protein
MAQMPFALRSPRPESLEAAIAVCHRSRLAFITSTTGMRQVSLKRDSACFPIVAC